MSINLGGLANLGAGLNLSDAKTVNPNIPVTYRAYVLAAATQYALNPGLLAGLIETESSWNPNAVSSTGAVGLTQLEPATAKSLGVTDSRNPRQNIFGGAKYLSQLLKQYNGDVDKALQAYNGGPGNVGIPATVAYSKTVQQNAKKYGYNGKPTDSNDGSGASIIQSATDTGANTVINSANALASIASSVVNLIGTLLSKDFWFRFGKGMLGAVVLILGVWALFEMYIRSDGTSSPSAII
jgi:hypothetical protein